MKNYRKIVTGLINSKNNRSWKKSYHRCAPLSSHLCPSSRVSRLSFSLSAHLSFFLFPLNNSFNKDDNDRSSSWFSLHTRPCLAWGPECGGHGPFLVGLTCSHHARNKCPSVPVQASYHLEWSGTVSVLERKMCLVWCGGLCCVCLCACWYVLICDVVCCHRLWRVQKTLSVIAHKSHHRDLSPLRFKLILKQ